MYFLLMKIVFFDRLYFGMEIENLIFDFLMGEDVLMDF